MKHNIKSFLAGALSTLLITSLTFTALAATGTISLQVTPVKIMVNNQEFKPKDAQGNEVLLFTSNGTTYCPLRPLAEAYGLQVGWDQQKQMATVGKSDITTPSKPDMPNTPTDTTNTTKPAVIKSIDKQPWTLYCYKAENTAFKDLTKADNVYQEGVIVYKDASYFQCDALLNCISDKETYTQLESILKSANGDKITDAQTVQYNSSLYVRTASISDFLNEHFKSNFDRADPKYCLQFKG